MSIELRSDSTEAGHDNDSADDNESVASHDLSDNDDLVITSRLNGAVDEHLKSEDSDHVQDVVVTKNEQELAFEEVPVSPVMQDKIRRIETVLETSCDLETLKQFALSEGGLITDEIRRKVWPMLLGIDTVSSSDIPSQAELENHEEYQQVILDVNRSLRRFPPGIPYDQRVALQHQLTRLILRVMIKYPHLRYYQGYHDVAVTFLLVVGESSAFKIMEKLSTGPLKDCMAPTMERTSYLLNYIFPLIYRLHPALFDYLERSQVGTMFCLPWFLTWYGHSLNKYQDVVRLYDFFLISPPLMSLYLAAEMVVYRQDEIFAVECDVPSLHSLLSKIPDNLPFEELLEKARDLYEQYPPESIEAEVSERAQRELRPRNPRAVPRRQLPPHHNNTGWRWLQWNQGTPRRRYAFLFVPVVTTLVVIYAYFKSPDGYTFDLITSIR